MYTDLKKEAKKKVEAKKGFYITAFIFSGVAAILVFMSFVLPYPAAFWVVFPILPLALVLGILYLSIFGIPYSGILSKSWEEEELEKEMVQLYQQKRRALPPLEDLPEEDRLELKELERLKRKWEWGEDLV